MEAGRVFGNRIREGRQIKEIIWSQFYRHGENGQMLTNKMVPETAL